MAEQSSHNVVEKPQSTSGSPLVDAAANPNTTAPADRGTYSRPSATSTTDDLKSANTYAIGAFQAAAKGKAELERAKNAAEPSAGDAAEPVPHDLASTPAHSVTMNGIASSELPNGTQDDASVGDGPADDRSIADISVDVSINSDTDNGKQDVAEKKDGGHHMRNNSVKKPTIFSKVTATKSFMSKVTPTAPVPPKVGEKPSPASAVLQLSSKPRLVAKTGASLANLQKSRLGADGPSGPDASKVWNKNRPTALPAPRTLTDEELKQQFGIHLATRLQSEEDGKESKWADIDDDEDDWAPDAVVWMDGTKSTLAPDVSPPPKEPTEQKLVAQQPVKASEGTRPVLALKQRSDMKILKPGNAASLTKLSGSAVPSPSPDKALTSKSPAPAPAKSPWAPVPKVDSISPINPPVQQTPAPPKLATQDARAYEQGSQVPPAREMAADTFDRSWREGEGGTRELFNSTNGRYEPAPEGRRGSVRPEVGTRKPAVLQRPSRSAASPAEPSAAFQSRTSTQTDGSWGRRRGSSVSQGSMPSARRMSMNQRPELGQTPEDLPSQKTHSPVPVQAEPAHPPFPQQSTWDQQMPPRPAAEAEPTHVAEPAPPAEDPVQVQERVMREKRELAKKRRQEDEQREQVERNERLKAKLAALEGAGKSKKEREAEAVAAAAAAATAAATAATTASTTTTITKASSSAPDERNIAQQPPASSSSALASASASASTSASAPATTAPSLEPQALTTATGKSHAESPALPTDKLPLTAPSTTQPAGGQSEKAGVNEPSQRQATRQQLSPRAAARAQYQQPAAPYTKPAAPSSYSPPGGRKPQPSTFDRSPHLGNDAFTPWPTTAPSRNVWGTSGIGNGTFASSNDFAPVPMSQQISALPLPPGMPRPSTSARISPQGFGQESRSPSLQQQQLSEQQRAFPPPGIESRPDAFASQPRLNGMSPAPPVGRPPHPPGPIGPPSRSQHQAQHRQDGISAWNTAAARLPNQYASEIAAADEKRKHNVDSPAQPSDNRYKETYKKTTADQGKLGAPRRYDATEYTIHDAQGSHSVSSHSPAPPATQTQPSASFPSASPMHNSLKQHPESHVRIPDPARNPAHGGTSAPQPPIGPPLQYPVRAYQTSAMYPTMPIAPITESKDQSPPPPESESHPVNQGIDSQHPHVKLPPPQAKVKLPPTSPSGSATVPAQYSPSALMPHRMQVWGQMNANRPIVMNEAWQARFNGLFNRTPIQTETPPSPPKTPPKIQGPVLAVASSSKTAMPEQTTGATVSLPVSKKAAQIATSAISTKPTIDEMFMEELRFGSTPIVKIPRNTSYNALPYPVNARQRQQFSNSQLHKRLDVQSSQEPFFYKSPQGYFVAIRGTKLHNKLCKIPGAPEPHAKDDERKQYPTQGGNKEWQDRKPSDAQNGANSKDWHHERKSTQARNDGKQLQERTQPSRHEKNKNGNGKDNETASSKVANLTTSGGPKKSGHQKSVKHASADSANIESKAETAEGMKTESSGGDRKKTGWAPRGGRHNRNSNTTAAVTKTSTTPVKSS